LIKNVTGQRVRVLLKNTGHVQLEMPGRGAAMTIRECEVATVCREHGAAEHNMSVEVRTGKQTSRTQIVPSQPMFKHEEPRHQRRTGLERDKTNMCMTKHSAIVGFMSLETYTLIPKNKSRLVFK
jgi:hypothetical protein